MMFKFTFNIGSHLFNPFTAQRRQQQQREYAEWRDMSTNGCGAGAGASAAAAAVDVDSAFLQVQSPNLNLNHSDGIRRLPAPPQRIFVETDVVASSLGSTPSPNPIPILPRKRGWAPSSSSPSVSLSSSASTNGWFDTPSRYVEAAQSAGGGVSRDREYDQQDLPPAKRRKTIADSILSTALSAALIGTAVGMSAYRMWRDRGLSSTSTTDPQQDHDLYKTAPTDEDIVDHPPPPYEQEDWVHASVAQQHKVKALSIEPSNQASAPPAASISRTPRSSRASKARRAARYRGIAPPVSPSKRRLSPSKTIPPSVSHFNSEPDPIDVDDSRDELDSQLDSMDDKIRRLIEEGQKALGKEVVIMNDDDRNNEEGAVDDGLDGWEDENNAFNGDFANTSLRVPVDRRKKRRQSNANVHPYAQGVGAFHVASSASLPHSHPHSHPHAQLSHSGRSVSPHKGRPRALTGNSRLGSPVEREPMTSVQVIYEPLSSASMSASASASVATVSGEQFEFEDEDSLNLSQRMEKIRQAYRLR